VLSIKYESLTVGPGKHSIHQRNKECAVEKGTCISEKLNNGLRTLRDLRFYSMYKLTN
jgi:hypothetical protein